MDDVIDLNESGGGLTGLSAAPPIDEAKLTHLLAAHKLTAEDYTNIKDILGRVPTMAELGVFSAMWNEHCSYKSSKVHLKKLPTSGKNVVVGPGENAGVVRLDGPLCVAFKMESHNHPTFIEPYQGAATGVGGILRDVFCMGARPIANLNCLRFGERSFGRTRYLFERAVKGIGDYGNCIGVPTVGGNISFDKTYNGNCLVNAMTVGLIEEKNIFKGYASGVGNLLIYIGSATGRDGIHGATMASDSFQSAETEQKSTVQVGDPFAEKLLLEATLEILEKRLVVGLQDMGAAGLTSSSFEMADRAGNGLAINLDNVPVRANQMSAYELLLSESQERMLMVCEPGKWKELKEILDKWLLDYGVIGKVTESKRVQISHQNILEVDIPVAPLATSAPCYHRPMTFEKSFAAEEKVVQKKCVAGMAGKSVAEVLELMAAASGDKTSVYRQYDHHIGTRTVHGPDHGGAALMWVDEAPSGKYLGVSISTSCQERYCVVDPYWGAAHSFMKAIRMIYASGGEPLGATDCLNFGNPEDSQVMGQFSQAIEGLGLVARECSVPFVSGNVSLYNETDGTSIFPTPMIGVVGKNIDIRKAPAAIATGEGFLALLSTHKVPSFQFSGSLLAKVFVDEEPGGQILPLDFPLEKACGQYLSTLIADGKILACRDIGEGGLMLGVLKMCGPKGLSFDLSQLPDSFQTIESLFADLVGSYLIQFPGEKEFRAAVQLLKRDDLTLSGIGHVSKTGNAKVHQDELPSHRLQQLLRAFLA